MEIFAILVGLTILIGSILGFISIVKIISLKSEVQTLKHQVAQLHKSSAIHESAQAETPSPAVAAKQPQALPTPPPTKKAKSNNKAEKQPRFSGFSFEKFIMGNGLLWIGAIVLSLGGLFLAKYSIEAGLFPPAMRILLGLVFGVALIVAAEFLHRQPKRFNINTPVVSAALASGGLVTCYALTFVAFDFYNYLSPIAAFIVLSIIAIAATWGSLRFGPVLAIIGVVGAYIVPLLVNTGSNNVTALLMYVSVISISTMWLYSSVRREWLWWMTLAGHAVWFVVALHISVAQGSVTGSASNYNNLYLLTAYALLTLYMFTLAPIMGWRLRKHITKPFNAKSLLMPHKSLAGFLLSMVGVITYFLLLPFDASFLPTFCIIVAVLLLAPLRHSVFDSWPFVALGFALLVFWHMPHQYDYQDNLFVFSNGYLFIQCIALVLFSYAALVMRMYPNRSAYALYVVVAPLLLYAFAYSLSDKQAATLIYPIFAFELGLLSVLAAILVLKSQHTLTRVSYLLLANGAIVLVLTMLLSASTLTLALTAQIALMGYLGAKHRLMLPSWLFKLAVVAVIARLTVAPWLPKYAGEFVFGLHWSTVVYPAAFALLFFARYQLTSTPLKAWFSGALLHLAALFVTTETSLLLIGEYPSLDRMDFKQSTVLAMNYLILSSVYLWRGKLSSFPKLYQYFSGLLLLAFVTMQGFASVRFNPFFNPTEVGTNPIVNWLTPLWLVPCVLFVVNLKLKLMRNDLVKPYFAAAAIFAFLYINGVIRLLFNAGVSLADYPIGQAELYAYSIVYLLLAIAAIVYSQQKSVSLLNKVGFAILATVVLKAFLIDMANLEGLYRAMSFIGLGLSLVGVGWLFQRLKKQTD